MRRKGLRKSIGSMLMAAVLVAGLCPGMAVAEGDGAVASADAQSSPLVNGIVGNSSAEVLSLGYKPEGIDVESIHDANESAETQKLEAAALPSSYSSVDRGFVTSVKDQSVFGACWTFQAMACIESSLLAHGQVSSTEGLDFSERHLAYFGQHVTGDPLGNTTKDQVIPYRVDSGKKLKDSYLDFGGNGIMATCALSSWQGVAAEKTAPYQELLNAYDEYGATDTFLEKTALPKSIAYSKDVYHLSQMRIIDSRDSADIKRAIQQYGAVGSSVYSHKDYFDSTKTNLYNYKQAKSNHSITLVGWNDNYSKSNFAKTPKKDGAWLAKNSWGTSGSSQGGYFWISYEDATMASGKLCYVYEVDKPKKYDNVYQYDGTTCSKIMSLASGSKIANTYKAKGNPGGAERLKAVSFMLSSVNVKYSIQVYLNPKAGNPSSGTAMLPKPVTGKTTYGGYYTVALPKSVLIPEGAKYSTVVTLSHADGSEIEVFVDMDDDDGDLKYSNYTQKGQSFFLSPSNKSWYDCANDSASLRLKAFTNNRTASTYKTALKNKVKNVKFRSKTFTYNGKKHSLVVKGKLPRGVTVSYVGNGKKAVGKYKVIAKFTYGKAKSPYVTKKAQLTIKKA